MAAKKSKKNTSLSFKKTSQGRGRWSKYPHNKKSKLYRKKYRGQGK
tara:strand:- start:162 stop:299 length:138 start_codon:yes stop_codon:yes gene_type:complete